MIEGADEQVVGENGSASVADAEVLAPGFAIRFDPVQAA
jgi:hypothetical protein